MTAIVRHRHWIRSGTIPYALTTGARKAAGPSSNGTMKSWGLPFQRLSTSGGQMIHHHRQVQAPKRPERGRDRERGQQDDGERLPAGARTAPSAGATAARRRSATCPCGPATGLRRSTTPPMPREIQAKVGRGLAGREDLQAHHRDRQEPGEERDGADASSNGSRYSRANATRTPAAPDPRTIGLVRDGTVDD